MNFQLIEIQYFGPISSFVGAMSKTNIVLEKYENWQKMSFRNRCQILGAGKVINLSVPLVGGRDQKGATWDKKIDNAQAWQVQHWRTLESCYNRSPFFEHYAPQLQKLVFTPCEYLWQLNKASLEWVLKMLKWEGEVDFTKEYSKLVDENTEDCRNQWLPGNRNQFEAKPYVQVFSGPFQPNLSILDALFNMGPQTLSYLRA